MNVLMFVIGFFVGAVFTIILTKVLVGFLSKSTKKQNDEDDDPANWWKKGRCDEED